MKGGWFSVIGRLMMVSLAGFLGTFLIGETFWTLPFWGKFIFGWFVCGFLLLSIGEVIHD